MVFNEKYSRWSFVLFPDIAPKDWLKRLKYSGIPFAVSPFHENDFNVLGTISKPHYHIIVVFPIPASIEFVCDFIKIFNCNRPFPFESVKSMYRYFLHSDDSSLAYDPLEIICGNGFIFPKNF